MIIDKLDESNFFLYAAKHYTNPYCYDTLEFYDDLNRFKYLKRLFSRYEETGELKERLILNHIIILNNVFGPHATVRILYFKLKDEFKYIKPFLILLNILPDKIYNINNEKVIDVDQIDMDHQIVKVLRQI